jgi:ubiquinone/menaquinone biosynthesis C-methylase UbiE
VAVDRNAADRTMSQPRPAPTAEEDETWTRWQRHLSETYEDVFYRGNPLVARIGSAGHRLIEKPFQPGLRVGRVLEVGGGGHSHLPYVAHSFDHYVIVDVDPRMLRAAASVAAAERVPTIAVADARRLPYADGTFDRLVSVYSLEHLNDPHLALKEWARVVRDDGVISIAVPTEGGLAWAAGRYVSTRRTYRRLGYDYDYIVAREHVNTCARLVALIRHYFPDRDERWYPTGVPTPHVNFVFATTIRVHKAKVFPRAPSRPAVDPSPTTNLAKARAEQRTFHLEPDPARFANRVANPFLRRKETMLARRVGEYLPESARLLEVGCGEGSNLWFLARQRPDCRLFGADLSAAKAAFARRTVPRSVVAAADALSLPFVDATFDAVLCRDLLHHVNWDRAGAVAECLRVLRGGGTLVILEGNGRTLLNRLFRTWYPVERGMKDSTPETLLNLLAAHGHPHLQFVEPSSLMRATGFVVGWPSGATRIPAVVAYIAAAAWESVVALAVPRRRWVYMILTLRRQSLREPSTSGFRPSPIQPKADQTRTRSRPNARRRCSTSLRVHLCSIGAENRSN